MRRIRFFKQLEFVFFGRTRSPLRVDKILAVPPPDLTSPSPPPVGYGGPRERPIHLGRDRALESQARDLLHALGADKLGREIRVEWNPRLKTCAGRADYREKLISLNPLLLDLNHSSIAQTESNPDRNLECIMHSNLNQSSEDCSKKQAERIAVRDEVDRTLRHELAHLLAQWRVGRRRIAPHGKEWRRACCDLGIADEARCHDLLFAAKVYEARYVYRCPNCKEEFPRVRRIRRAIACLACCRKYNDGDFDPRFHLKLTSAI